MQGALEPTNAITSAADYATAQHTRIWVDWKTGVHARDWDALAKKENLNAMAAELNKLEETVKDILQEMAYLRRREEEMRNINGAWMDVPGDWRSHLHRGNQWPGGLVFAWVLVYLHFVGGVAIAVPQTLFQAEKAAVTEGDYIGSHLNIKCICVITTTCMPFN